MGSPFVDFQEAANMIATNAAVVQTYADKYRYKIGGIWYIVEKTTGTHGTYGDFTQFSAIKLDPDQNDT